MAICSLNGWKNGLSLKAISEANDKCTAEKNHNNIFDIIYV